MDIKLDCAQDDAAAADQLRANLQLSSGAEIESVTCANQSCSVEFTSAEAGSTVEGTMPTEIASTLCAGGAVAGGSSATEEQPLTAAGEGGGTSDGTTNALIGVAAAGGIAGAVMGGIALSEDNGGGGTTVINPPPPGGGGGSPTPNPGGPFIPRSPSQ
jgi:hypothetical protein